MSSSSLESIIVNAKRLAQRLKSREADADRILAEAEEVNNQLETMRQVSEIRVYIPLEKEKKRKKENQLNIFVNFDVHIFFVYLQLILCYLWLIQFKDDLDLLNSIARDKSNAQMIHQINQENPQLREMHTENMRLRVSLEDHQRALEHIMSKYREHTQLALNNTKLNFQELFKGETEKSLVSDGNRTRIMVLLFYFFFVYKNEFQH